MRSTASCKGIPRAAATATLALISLFCPAAFAATAARPQIDLNGAWQFRLDPAGAGTREQWYDPQVAFPDSIQVPGCWQAQGFGEPSGILRHDYTGTAWYRKSVSIPESWKGKRVTLRLGGALRIADLFVNGKPAGRHDGMNAPFEFDVSDAIRPGAGNWIALRISNPGKAPSESPDKQSPVQPTGSLNYIGNWGGIYGPVELNATNRVWIEQLWVRSNVSQSTARFGIEVHNGESQAFVGRLQVAAGSHQGTTALAVPSGKAVETEVAVPMPGARLWSPEHPDLYTAVVSVLQEHAEIDRVEQRFGMREIKTQGSVLLLNGKPLYLRGYGDDDIEVLTGVPPASKEVYLTRLRLARSFGFNAVRFHSFTPVREYFEAADEAGMLVMAELPVAYTQYLLPFKDFVRSELTSTVLAYRNHPSWLSLAIGNEFNLNWLKDENSKRKFQETVGEFYRLAKSLMPDRMVLSNDGLRMEPTDMLSLGRGTSANHPTVRHEFGDYYCSLPDLSLIPKFTGVMFPQWLEAKSRWVNENGLAAEYPAYVRNSQRLLQLGHKFQIERVRREADVEGYEYWLIVDYPGGTGEGDSWEEGWFDFFWQPKGVSPEDGREINSAVLPLIDRGPGERTLWADSVKDLKLLVSNYGAREIREGAASWRISSGGKTVAESRANHFIAPLGKISPVSSISIGHVAGDVPRKLELAVDVDGHVNHWNFWTFPRLLMTRAESPIAATVAWPGLSRYYPFVKSGAHSAVTGSVWVTSVLDNAAIDFLRSGGRVWLALEKTSDSTFFPAPGGALGTMVLEHPALQGFPHDDFCDLQFYNLMQRATPFPLDHLPKVSPIIGGIRTKAGFLSKTKDLSKVAYLFEAKVGAGRLLVSTLQIGSQLNDSHPEAVFLCDRILRYCDSNEFRPQAEITPDQLSQEVAGYLR